MLITLFFKVDVLQVATWKTSFLLVLYSYNSEFIVEYKLYLKNNTTSQVYKEVRGFF
jgi:hypothetical protein